MAPRDLGPYRRVLVVQNGSQDIFPFDHLLRECGLLVVYVDLRMALATEYVPVALYRSSRWDALAAGTVRRLAERDASVFVICPDAVQDAVSFAILQSGATDVGSESEDAVRAMLLKVQRYLALVDRLERRAFRWEIKGLTFDDVEDRLLAPTRAERLTQMEAQVLRCLCAAGAADPTGGLTTIALARDLGIELSTVRFHMHGLREKMEHVLGHPRVLFHGRRRGYYLEPAPTEPSLDQRVSKT